MPNHSKSAKSSAAASTVNDKTDPVAALPTQTRVRQKRAPTSPRTLSNRLSSQLDLTHKLNQRDVTVMRQAVLRSLNQYNKVSTAVAASKRGHVKAYGKDYTADDVKEMKNKLGSNLELLTRAAVLVNPGRKPIVPPAEIEKRRAAALETSRVAFEVLSDSLIGSDGCRERFIAALVEKARASIEKRVPSNASAASQIGRPFFINDRLRKFIHHANLGNGIALLINGCSNETHCVKGGADPEAAYMAVANDIGKDPAEVLGIKKQTLLKLADPRMVISPLMNDDAIANASLLMVLIARYIRVNKLKDPKTGRINVDNNIKESFGKGDLRWMFMDRDVTPKDLAGTPEISSSVLAQMREKKDKKGVILYDGQSFPRTRAIAIIIKYRIPQLPDEKANEKLKDSRVYSHINALNVYLANS